MQAGQCTNTLISPAPVVNTTFYASGMTTYSIGAATFTVNTNATGTSTGGVVQFTGGANQGGRPAGALGILSLVLALLLL